MKEEKKLSSDDLKTPQDPEEFTKRYIIEKVFQILGVNYETGERRFITPDGIRKADYGANKGNINFLVEVKPLNENLYKNSPDGAVNQIKGLFRLAEAKENYDFGIATDGLKWVFISKEGEIICECDLIKDFDKIREYISGKKAVKKSKREEKISKKFYEWYNALLHGGYYRDLKNKRKYIAEDDCLVKNIFNVRGDDDAEEIAQVIIDRLIFIKFLQAKGLIKEDILGYLASLEQDS